MTRAHHKSEGLNCVRRLISTELHLSVFSAETISSDKMSKDISDTLKLLYFVKKMSEHRYDLRILESCVDLNLLMVERQDPDNFTCFHTQERCALEIAAYVFNCKNSILEHLNPP